MGRTVYAYTMKWPPCKKCGEQENPVYMKNQHCRKCDASERELREFTGKVRYVTQSGANAGTIVD